MEENLTVDDPVDAFTNRPFKSFPVTLKGNRTYRIEMVGGSDGSYIFTKYLNGYVRLLDSAKKEVARGGRFVEWNCPADGDYTLIASSSPDEGFMYGSTRKWVSFTLNVYEPLPDDARTAYAQFRRPWTVTRAEVEGTALSPEALKEIRWEFQDGFAGLTKKQDHRSLVVALHPITQPRSINLTIWNGPEKDSVMEGIFEFDGPTLKLAFPAKPGDPRPANFEAAARAHATYYELTPTK